MKNSNFPTINSVYLQNRRKTLQTKIVYLVIYIDVEIFQNFKINYLS